MVAHDITDAPFLFAVMVWRRPFFQEDPLIMFLTLWLNVLPIDEVEVEPRFVVAALIGRAQAQDNTENREGTMKPYLPLGRLKEPTNVSPVARNRSWSPQWCGARTRWQNTVSKGFFDGTDFFPLLHRHAAPLKSPATRSTCSSSITARIVRMSFLTIPRFWA